MPGRDGDENNGLLPPWLWFWLVTYGLSLPWQIRIWRQMLTDLFFHKELPETLTGTHFAFVLRLSNVPELLPSLALLLGILAIFFPWLRAAYLEWRYRLAKGPHKTPAINEIGNFLLTRYPGLRISSNVLRTDQLAFVYPFGYRNAAVALFGGVIKLWRSDRPAAEAVLIHEMGHYRHGDALVVGAGSFFETVVRHWLTLYFLFCALPLGLVWADQRITFLLKNREMPLFTLLSHEIDQLCLYLPGMLFQLTGLLFWMAGTFILPLVAIWCAEFNADRFAIDTLESADSLVHALKKQGKKVSWWRWVLGRMTHPPTATRCWMALHASENTGFLLLLLVFPLAYFAKLFILLGRGLSGYLISYPSIAATEIFKKLGVHCAGYLKMINPILFAIAMLLFFWPHISGYWEQIFCGSRGQSVQASRKGYLSSAVILAVTAGVCRVFFE